ncbi:hypothetical protein ACR77J_07520 [Tissierella praeacuta]|uniref:hypothetical protein n=1 Tax=Tissierella praeacuta TaxID=43131 RepID=UPI003DA242CF
MSNGLKHLLDRFYEEMEEEESFDLGELACLLVPKLDYRIDELEQENQWLYGKLNIIGDIIEEGRKEIK